MFDVKNDQEVSGKSAISVFCLFAFFFFSFFHHFFFSV